MSEQLPTQERHEHGPETSPEHNKEQNEKLKALVEKAEKATNKNAEHMPEIQQQAKEQAISGKEYATAEHAAKDRAPSTHHVSKELKRQSFQRSITRIQKHLSTPDKLLSKAIHQPVIDQLSQVGEKTVARPSGLLGGSIVAFAGSSGFLWAAKHYGYSYNYLIFFLLFVGGFGVGLVIELILHVILRNKRRA